MDPQYAIQAILSFYLGMSVFLLVWAVFRYPVTSEPATHRRIAVAVGADKRMTLFEMPLLKPVMSLALGVAERLGFASLRQQVRKDLDASGNPNGYSVSEYLAVCIACGAGLALASTLLGFGVGVAGLPFGIAFMGLIGFIIPLVVLNSTGGRRMTAIAKQLPYTLDLIALMMGAGSTFTEAIQTLIRDNPEEPLNQELRVVMAEIEFGTQRNVALSNLGNRIPLESLRSVVGAINQAEMLGTPLSAILMAQAQMIRTHRSVRAEKLAASASLRILIPSMLILIAVVITVFGPLLIRYWRDGGIW